MIDFKYLLHLEEENKDMEVKILSFINKIKDSNTNFYLNSKNTKFYFLEDIEKLYKEHFGISEQRGGIVDNN